MKALLAEYTVFDNPAPAHEGRAMLRVLKESFENCGYEVLVPESGRGSFEDELRRLAPLSDIGLVIAPDHQLSRYTKIIEDLTYNIGCGSMNVALCANKRITGSVLAANGVAVPAEVTEGLRVIKQTYGCATENMRLSDEEPGEGEFGQEYIRGENISVSLIGSRVVGEACLYFTGAGPLVLSVNRQNIVLKDGVFHYEGGETPVEHPMMEEIIATARKAATVLGCQGYVGIDMVVADRPYVVDVNPRPTSSLVGIVEIMDEEIADLLVRASHGHAPEEVHLNGHVTFDRHSQVVRS